MKNFFKVIQIQTIDNCNFKCSFCPNKFLTRTSDLMDINVYNNIVDELSEQNYDGRFSPYLMNEPLMDKRIPELISTAKKKLPKAYIYISTNGYYLDQNLLKLLSESGLTLLGISVYNENIEERIKSLDFSKLETKVVIKRYTKSYKEKYFYNRGGLVDVNINRSIPQASCRKPFRQMYINYNGESVLCCSDWKNECIMGNTKTNKLMEIWNNDIYQKYRNHLSNNDRSKLKLCKKCNNVDS